MVTSFLTQLAFSGRSFRARKTSDELASDPESDLEVVDSKVLRGKSRIEVQLVDRSKEMILGFAVLTRVPHT
jgi:hypothetical protein